MEKDANKRTERCCELAGETTSALKPSETPCMDDRQFAPEDFSRHKRSGTNLCADGIEMPVLGKTMEDQVNILARSAARWDKAIGTIDKLHQSNNVADNLALLETKFRTGAFQHASFAGEVQDFTNFRRSVRRIWTSHNCSDFLDVQEASSRVSQQCRIRNNCFGRHSENEKVYQHCNCGTVFKKTCSPRRSRKRHSSSHFVDHFLRCD